MLDRFLCQDDDCWIAPDRVAADRRARYVDLACEPVALYTPIDLAEPGRHWLADVLRPRPSRLVGDVAIRAAAARIELPSGALSAIVGPIGAPSTVATLELAAAFGARSILFFGICGSLQPDLRIGDLVLVEHAIREEGTSYHYLPADAPAVASGALLDTAGRVLDAAGEPYRRGTIWTTDAPYRETRTKVRRLAGEGVLGVEMEVSAVYALAQYRQLDAAALLVVSDQLVGERWTGIRRDTFRERCERAVRLLAEVADAWLRTSRARAGSAGTSPAGS